jgi:DNA polymerase epsilon subunit 1
MLCREIRFQLEKQFGEFIEHLDIVPKVDLDQVNHLSGITQKYIKLSFKNRRASYEVLNFIKPIVKKNKANKETQDAYEGFYDQGYKANERNSRKNFMSQIIDIREHDVPIHVRI